MTTAPYVNAQAVFYQQYEQARRDEVVGILLALFLGTFGVHHFYLRRTGLGILYIVFFWTGIPSVLGFIECFFMPARVREFNAIQAAGIAAALGITMPAYGQPININVNVPPGAVHPRRLLLRWRSPEHWWHVPNVRRPIRRERSFAQGAVAHFKRLHRASPTQLLALIRHFRSRQLEATADSSAPCGRSE